ncbi:MAG: MmcQ/YjbR family DNA-binding protein [Bacteroidota bacterium]
MNLDDIRSYCLRKNGKITGEFPFDEEVLVFKVFGKIFVLLNVNEFPLSLNLKCDPERALELRERYPAVQPGYHMHKKLWNTVSVDGSIPESEVFAMIDHSYDEVVKKLPMKIRRTIATSSRSTKHR